MFAILYMGMYIIVFPWHVHIYYVAAAAALSKSKSNAMIINDTCLFDRSLHKTLDRFYFVCLVA